PPRPHVGEVAVEATVLGEAAQPQPVVVAPGDLDDRALRDRERQAQTVGVVDVLADQAGPAGPGPAAVRLAPVQFRERPHDPTSRSRCAIRSGSASLIQAPAPDSEPARYLSFPGARRRENSR